jgi:hypothetical protein
MVKLYVEGGGDTSELKSACRKGFRIFISKAGLTKHPRIIACGSRRDAFESYCTAIASGEDAVLLVDSEAAVAAEYHQGEDADRWLPWAHLKNRRGDGWDKPEGEPDTDCHLMVECMENWFLADRATLSRFFGQGFEINQLPAPTRPIEQIPKTQVYDSLAAATRNCKTKDQYGKGAHSFKLLEEISPQSVTAASPWAKRFVDELKKKMDAR